jgi:hypothetical protein
MATLLQDPSGLQLSAVHGLWSSHVLLVKIHPASGSQLASSHGRVGLHVVIALWLQFPEVPTQKSSVQALESSQLTGTGTQPWTRSQTLGLQKSVVVHVVSAWLHTALPVAELQVSVVHALRSSQLYGTTVHTPFEHSLGLHGSVHVHAWLPHAMQLLAIKVLVQFPPEHVSEVQGFESSQLTVVLLHPEVMSQ